MAFFPDLCWTDWLQNWDRNNTFYVNFTICKIYTKNIIRLQNLPNGSLRLFVLNITQSIFTEYYLLYFVSNVDKWKSTIDRVW